MIWPLENGELLLVINSSSKLGTLKYRQHLSVTVDVKMEGGAIEWIQKPSEGNMVPDIIIVTQWQGEICTTIWMPFGNIIGIFCVPSNRTVNPNVDFLFLFKTFSLYDNHKYPWRHSVDQADLSLSLKSVCLCWT